MLESNLRSDCITPGAKAVANSETFYLIDSAFNFHSDARTGQPSFTDEGSKAQRE